MSAALLNVNGKIYLVKHRPSDAEMRERSEALNASLCGISTPPSTDSASSRQLAMTKVNSSLQGLPVVAALSTEEPTGASRLFPNTRGGHDALISFYFVYVPSTEKKHLELVLNLYAKLESIRFAARESHPSSWPSLNRKHLGCNL